MTNETKKINFKADEINARLEKVSEHTTEISALNNRTTSVENEVGNVEQRTTDLEQKTSGYNKCDDAKYIYRINAQDGKTVFGILGSNHGAVFGGSSTECVEDEEYILKYMRSGELVCGIKPLGTESGIVGVNHISNALPKFVTEKNLRLDNGEVLFIPYTLAFADVTYCCNFEFSGAFGIFTIGRGYDPFGTSLHHTTNAGWLEITPTKVYEKARQFAFTDYPHTYKEYEHGLTLKSPISIVVQTKIAKGSKYESLITITNGDGNTFTIDKTGTNADRTGISTSIGTTYIKTEGMGINVKSFSFANARWNKIVWLYGDSYFGSYWRELLGAKFGIDSYGQMFAGGEDSTKALSSLKFDIQHGCPKYILYGMGMNDNNDTEESVNVVWKKNTEEFLEICDKYKIEVTLLTVPNVRYNGVLKEDHRKLNEYIRNSGRPYIEIANLMEDGDGNWFEGLRSNTPEGDIHPSQLGSAIIASAILSAYPQLSVEQFNK